MKISLLLLALVLLNALISIARHGLLHANHSKITKKAEEGNKRAAMIQKNLDNPDDIIATVDLLLLVVNILSGIYTGLYVAPLVLARINDVEMLNFAGTFFHLASVFIAIVVSSCFMIFSDMIPKIVAGEYAENIAVMFARPLNLLSKLFKPLTVLLFFLAKSITALFGLTPSENAEPATEEDIRKILDASVEGSGIDTEEMNMIKNIFAFDDTTVEDISTHRTDISAIDIDDDFNDILLALGKIKYSRIPVYEENIDNIIGILHVKDLMRHILNKVGETHVEVKIKGGVDLREILRKPYFVPVSKKSDELFKDMKLSKIHIAIVVDEYGGTVGLVTMEDLIEEIMGNIFDEYDDEETPEIDVIDQNTFKISGTTSLDRVAEVLEIPLPVEDYDTVSGFVIGQLGHIPGEEDRPEVEFNDLLFKVERVEDKRIAEIIVIKT